MNVEKRMKKLVQSIETDIFNYRSKELFINLKPSDIPPKGHRDREAFISYEEDKCLQGVTINGIPIPPTFYWDINHWKILKDIKDSRGIIRKVPSLPDIRDNDWKIHNGVYQAELARSNFVEGTARQLGKSKNKASIMGRDLMLIDNCNDLLLCGNSGDLKVMLEYLFFGTENCTDFFRVPRLTNDMKSLLFKWGFKTPQGEEIVKSGLHVRNAQNGKVTEVSAGVTIYRGILDECGKYNFRSSYETIKPALVSEFGVRSASILSFTGGDVLKSKDAQEIFLNPQAANFASFDNEEKKTGFFLSGIYRQDLKKQIKFGEYLGLKDKDSELYNLPIRIADEEKANEVLDAEEALAAKSIDPTAYIKQKMYNPRKIADMFLTPDVNPFNIAELQRQKEYLLANPIGTAYTLEKVNGIVIPKLSNKQAIHEYPLQNMLVDKDAPIIFYDMPKYTDHYDLQIIGVDSYNEDEGTSLGSIYGFRREHTDLTDNFQKTMIFSYTARPQKLRDFHKNALLLQELCNGQVLFEVSGNSFLQYFDERHKAQHIMDTYNIQKEMNPRSNTSTTKGLRANEPNNKFRLNVTKDYLEEDLGNGRLGYSRILDPVLCDELIQWDGEKNADRYDAFSYGIVHMYAKQKYNTRPFITSVEKEIEKPVEKKKIHSVFRPMTRGKSLIRR